MTAWESAMLGCGQGALAAVGMYFAWSGVDRLAMRRLKTQADKIYPTYAGKILRHAPTGTVGVCVGLGPIRHDRWGFVRGKIFVALVRCPDCVRACIRGGPAGFAMAAQHGHVMYFHWRDVFAATAEERAEFSALLTEGEL